jgi:hypothetical protein
MSGPLHVGDIEVLGAMERAVARFSERTLEELRAASRTVQETGAWLDDRVAYWRRATEGARADLNRAAADLRECESSTDGEGHRQDCRQERDEVRHAMRTLRDCERSWHVAQVGRSRFQEAVTEYEREARRLGDVAGRHTVRVRAFLSKTAVLYSNVHGPTGGVAAAGPASSGANSRGVSRWIDKGITALPVDALPDDAELTQKDFIKASEAELQAGIKKWLSMRPLIDSGEGASSDYWAAIDRQQGLDYHGGHQHVYDAFYGSDCIRVERSGVSYSVTNGRHRIWVARRMHVHELPVRLIEDTDAAPA